MFYSVLVDDSTKSVFIGTSGIIDLRPGHTYMQKLLCRDLAYRFISNIEVSLGHHMGEVEITPQRKDDFGLLKGYFSSDEGKDLAHEVILKTLGYMDGVDSFRKQLKDFISKDF